MLLAILAVVLFDRLPAAGFLESRDFTLAFTARLLADLGLDRLDIAGTLGGPELAYALSVTPPITLVTLAFLFRIFGDTPAGIVYFSMFLHLLVALAAMLTVRRWRPNKTAPLVAGLVIVAHPLAAGIMQNLIGVGAMLSTLAVLLAINFANSYARSGNLRLLGPLMLSCLIAAACNASGLMVVPTVLLIALTVRARKPLGLMRRSLSPLVSLVGATVPVAYMLSTIGMPLYLRQLPQLRQIGLYAAYSLHCLFLPVRPNSVAPHQWHGYLAIAVLASLVFTITIYVALRRPRLLIWPALAIGALLLRGFALAEPGPLAGNQLFVACYLPLVFTGLWLAEICPGDKSLRLRLICLALMLVVFIPQTNIITQVRADQGLLIDRMGREINQIIEKAPMGADTIFPVKPSTLRLVETAFVAGQYRADAPRQIRYRMVVGGQLRAAPLTAQLGRELGAWVRLPFNDKNLVIGLAADGRSMVDLSSIIRTKMTLADDIIFREKHAPPAWDLTDEQTVEQWNVGAGCRDQREIDPQRYGWFMEGFFYRLHPHLGQMGFL